MFNCSFQIIYKGNRQEFLDLLLNGTPTKTYSLQPVNSSIGLGRKCQFLKPVQLIHVDTGDAWHYQYIHRLTAADIRNEIKSQKAFNKLFSKRS